MLVFPCNVCHTSLSADESQAGQLVRCPTCLATLRVPRPENPTAPSAPPPVHPGSSNSGPARGTVAPAYLRGGAGAALGGLARQVHFNCAYCSSRLEATEVQSGQDGVCPTCGNSITIPILDRYGRLIDPRSGQIIKPDPHPVHAYAAAGERAPTIIRADDDKQSIQCPRCWALSPISANNCKSCGMPFTMEGTTLEASATSNGFCVASLVLGIIGLPVACVPIFPVLAILFGIIGYTQVNRSGMERGGKGMAIAGIICGIIGSLIAMRWWFP